MKAKHIRAGMYAMFYPCLKDIAEEYGYNLVIHGSMIRDFDLIAIPWTETAREPDEMIFEMQEYLKGIKTIMPNGKPFQYTSKPHGRKAITIEFNRGDRHGEWVRFADEQYYLDISIMPLIKS